MLLSYNFESMGRPTKNFIEWGSEEKFITIIYKSQTSRGISLTYLNRLHGLS